MAATRTCDVLDGDERANLDPPLIDVFRHLIDEQNRLAALAALHVDV